MILFSRIKLNSLFIVVIQLTIGTKFSTVNSWKYFDLAVTFPSEVKQTSLTSLGNNNGLWVEVLLYWIIEPGFL